MLPRGDRRGITWWDHGTEGVTARSCSPCDLQSRSQTQCQGTGTSSPRAAFLEALECELSWPIPCNSQLPETPILNPSVVSFWLGKGRTGLQWQDLDSLFAGWIFWMPAMVFPRSGHPSVCLSQS